MPIDVNFSFRCSAADRGRVRAAEDLFIALFEAPDPSKAPTELPPELAGVFRDVDEFASIFGEDDCWSIGAFSTVDGDRLRYEEQDAELDRLIVLIHECCPESLPIIIHWTADGGPGGRVTVCKDEERWLAAWETEETIYSWSASDDD